MPALTLQGQSIPINALSLFSVVSKFMGNYPTDWNQHLRSISQRHYNMVHFTPLTMRGDSNSPYSVYDQLQFDKDIFQNGEKDIEELTRRMEKEYGLLALTDVVWNHTANNSKWLEEHPEAGYSVATAPWLEAALELDTALLEYGEKLETLGLPIEFNTVDDLQMVINGVRPHVIDAIRLWEYYVINIESDIQRIIAAWKAHPSSVEDSIPDARTWTLKEKADFIRQNGLRNSTRILGRFARSVDEDIGWRLLYSLFGTYDGSKIVCVEEELKRILDEINVPFYKEFDSEVNVIQEQLFHRIKYLRIDDHGPKLGPVTKTSPLVETYFTRLPINETTRKHDPKMLALVNNGWRWNADAMTDNAGPDTRAYLRREIIVWGDCVKLRYGSSPQENPWLWDYMARYTRLMAKYFTGFRIDNCHSTPLVVAEYLLDQARTVRPNLVIFAELFTGCEDTDYVFVQRLGITALIREAMQAWSTQELSRLVHRHGGRPIGSFRLDHPKGSLLQTARSNERILYFRQTPVPALFMDCTHDNQVPAQKRDARDTLPNAALVAMCASATGSVIGYDEIYPKVVDIVTETRLYSLEYSKADPNETGPGRLGIGNVKKLLNRLHTQMGIEGYDETYIHHEGEYITVHRVHPMTRRGIFLVAHTAFPGNGDENGILKPIHLAGTHAKQLGSWILEVEADQEHRDAILNDKEFLRGLRSQVIEIDGARIDFDGQNTTITILDSLKKGSISLFETWVEQVVPSEHLDEFITQDAEKAFGALSLIDLNFVLYRCEAEERDASGGADGVYVIPKYGPLVYAGLQGWWSVLEDIIFYNNLGHPLCDNLRQGQWALDYIVGRMQRKCQHEANSPLQAATNWLKERFDAVRSLPSFLLPRYFAIIVQTAYMAAWRRGIELLGDDIQRGLQFTQHLAMVSVQQVGPVPSASLWPDRTVPCLAAGLPHFSVDWARCWGRDVFISLRGLLLCTRRFSEAKEHILAFASVLKHGLIPNLLSSGKLPRYNSRDSVWFFLQAIQDYTQMAPKGLELLDEKVPRRFLPYDDTWIALGDPRAYSNVSTIKEIIQEILQRHASGISFREHNAGPQLDMQMKSEGFQIDIRVDWETGFVFGGNQFNCGTWMDKMGESEKAGNKGVPGTPRDGAAVEIIGLLYSSLTWVTKLHAAGHYEYDGVKLEDGRSISFNDWASKIRQNFERCFYVPINPGDDAQHDIDSSIVHRRGIYKDLYKSGKPYEDYQLRPNFPIAMTVAPELFTPSRALQALAICDSILLGPTGMATLDPADLNYRPDYNNSEDSTDFATAKGRNYHQGPEWLWPRGYFLRALLHFDLSRRHTAGERTETIQHITKRLLGCKEALRNSPWKGLTELTNRSGSFCADSVRF